MNLEELRSEVRAAMEAQKLKQADVARGTGIGKVKLSRFLSGKGSLGSEEVGSLEGFLSLKKDAPVLDESTVQVLAEKLKSGRLVIFVGAGISAFARHKKVEKKRLPLWGALGQEVAKNCAFEDADAFDNPLQLFDAIRYGNLSREDLEEKVAECVDDSDYQLSEAHELIRRLPFKYVLTTNYDCLLDRLYFQAGERDPVKPIVVDEDVFSIDPFLFKLHGSIQTLDGRPTDLHTLTEEDYLNWNEKHPAVFKKLQNIFTDRTVLFVGYGLGDSHFNALMETVGKANPKRMRSYNWAWNPNPAKVKMYEVRNGMRVTAMHSEEDYVRAFQELEKCVQKEECALAVEDELSEEENQRQWISYQAGIEQMYRSANLQGLYVGQAYQRELVRMEEIFVEPHLAPLRAPRKEEKSEIGDLESAPLDEVRSSKQWLKNLEGRDDERRKIKAVSELLKPGKRVVIGDPGQGKSSLLQFCLMQQIDAVKNGISQLRPVYLRLSVWESEGAPSDEKSFMEFVRKRLMADANVSLIAVDDWLKGKVLWLLDGVDEVRNERNRKQLFDLLERLTKFRGKDHSGDSWVVSSRPSGYYEHGLKGDWTEWELMDLEEDESQKLLENWAKVLMRIEQLPLNAGEVYQKLKSNPGLARVVGNPLLLTMIVLFYKARLQLPRDRWQFYQHATEALAHAWQAYRARGGGHEVEEFPFLHLFLRRLALYMMKKGIVVVEARDLQRELEAFLVERGYAGEKLDCELMRFMRACEDLIGVIVSKGARRFGFLHLSFQEFYAAWEIRESETELKKEMVSRWDHPDWEEVWSLFVTSIESETRLHGFYGAVEKERHELDEVLWRPERQILQWAAISKSGLPANLAQRWKTEIQEWSNMGQESLKILQGWIGQGFPTEIRKELLGKLADEDWNVREGAVSALQGLVSEKEVREALLAKLEDEHWVVRESAVSALQGVVSEKKVREALLAKLEDEDGDVRGSARKLLSEWIQEEKF